LDGGGNQNKPIGYTGGIPLYEASRQLQPGVFEDPNRVPGSMGRRYFTDTTYGFNPAQTTAESRTMGGPQLVAMNKTFADQQAKRQADYDELTAAINSGFENAMSAEDTEGTDALVGAGTEAESPTASATTYNWENIATNIRNNLRTPAEAAQDYNMSEADVIFQLLNEGLTNPQEVYDYYGGDYSLEDIKNAYQTMGGTRTFAGGGLASFAPRGYYLGGPTDGMADKIPATIGGTEPARLSDGEFVIPADVVSHLGNGNSSAGAQNLYAMMDRVRQDRTGTTKQGRQINPNDYLA